MKGTLKKVLALALSLAMVFSTCITSFAAEDDSELEAGTYTVSVSASDYVSAMSVEFGGVVEDTATVVVAEDGTVTMTLTFTDILIFSVYTGWVSEYYDDTAEIVYGTITAQDGNEYTSVESVTITLSEIADTYTLSYYLQSTMMSFTRSVELTVDWSTAELISSDEEDTSSISAGTYTVSVSASDYVSAMSVEFGGVVEDTATVVVAEDGTVTMTLTFTDILIFSVYTGWVSEYYDDTAEIVYGTITAQDGNEYTSVESVTITLSEIADTYTLSYYLQSTMMSFTRSVELTVDWSTLTAVTTDDESTTTVSYTGTALVDGYEYYITVVVYVTDGVITSVEVTSDDVNDGTHASYSIWCFEQVKETFEESLVGLSVSAESIEGVDVVSGATMTSEAVIEAVEEALGLTESNSADVTLEAGKSYTVDITYKAAAHSLISDPTATADDDTDTVSASIEVAEDGQAYITIDIYNSEDMYITSYNGLHLGGTTDGTLSTDDTVVVEEDSDAVTGGSIVAQVIIPLDGYYNEYYTSVSVYVPSMSEVDMDGDGEADNGYFTVDPSTLSIDWSTLAEAAGEDEEDETADVTECSYTLYYRHADSTSSYSRYFGHFTSDGTYESGTVETAENEDGTYTLTVVVDGTSSMLSDVAMILDGYTYTSTTDDEGYITYEIILDSLTETIDFEFTYTITMAGRTNTHSFQMVLEGGTWSGHTYEAGEADVNDVITYTCSVCGDSYADPYYDGLVKINDGWYYYADGSLASDYTGLYLQTNGVTYYVEEGICTLATTAIIESDGVYYYVKNSRLQSSVTGLISVDGTWYYIAEGAVQTDYTGLYLQTNGVTYYVEEGICTLATTTVVESDGTYYYVKNSRVLTSSSGLLLADGTWYCVSEGVVQTDYTGLYLQTNGITYYVEEGICTLATTTTYEEDGVTYVIVNSRVTGTV